jgi:hypothetical protein
MKDKGVIEAQIKDRARGPGQGLRERTRLEKASVLVISPTHVEGEKLTAHIRRELKDAGRLGAEERELTQLVNQNWTEPEKTRAASYERGMVVEFRKGAGGFSRHERASVVDVDARAETVEVARTGGHSQLLPLNAPECFDVYQQRRLPVSVGERLRITQNASVDGHRFDNGNTVKVKALDKDGIVLENGAKLPDNFGHVAHGYVSTADSAQSKTVDSVLIGIGGDSMDATDMRRMYVAVSRARHEAASTLTTRNRFSPPPARHRPYFWNGAGRYGTGQRIVQEDIEREMKARREHDLKAMTRQPELFPSDLGHEIERKR